MGLAYLRDPPLPVLDEPTAALGARAEVEVYLKTISELLGHSSFSITADIYGHLTLDTKREAVNRLGSLFAAVVVAGSA